MYGSSTFEVVGTSYSCKAAIRNGRVKCTRLMYARCLGSVYAQQLQGMAYCKRAVVWARRLPYNFASCRIKGIPVAI